MATQRRLALTLALALSLCLSFAVVSAQTPPYRIPGVPVVSPTVSAVYANPAKFAGVAGGLSVPPAVFGCDSYLRQTTNAVYLVNSTSVGKALSSPYTIGQAYTQIEPRPHGGLVWAYGQGANITDPDELAIYTLAAFNSSTLVLVHSFNLMEPGRLSPTPTLGISTYETWLNPAGYLATNNAGTSVILTSGPQVYVLSATTGLTTANFTLPNSDEINILIPFILIFGHPYIASYVDSEAGYLVAVGPDDSLYFVDDNATPNGTHIAYHTSSTGTLLSIAYLDFSTYNFSAAVSLATDSAGFVYIGADSAQPFALKLNASLGLVGLYRSPYTPTNRNDYFQLSVSWGATPAQDAFYTQVGLGSSPMYIMNSAGVVQSSFVPNRGVGLGAQIVYDSFLDSFVESQNSGPNVAIRVARNFTILTQYPIPPPLIAGTNTFLDIGMPAVDGTGQVALMFYGVPSYVAVWNAAGQLTSFFTSQSQSWGLAFADSVLYMQSARNLSYIDKWTPSGVYLGNLSVPALGSTSSSYLGQMTYVSGQGSVGPALWVTIAQRGGPSIRAIDLTTGSITTVYANVSISIYYFALSPSRSVLYIAGGGALDSSLAPGISPFIAAADFSSGRIFALLDAGLKTTDNPSEAAGFQAVAVDAAGEVVVPDENSGFRLFAGLMPPSASVRGDPQFVGLRGQSFQVHGIDGAVYALISEEHTAVNARFVFLSSGECPIVDGHPLSSCWSHPGSYMGAVSIQVRSAEDAKLHTAVMHAGVAKRGFAGVEVDGAPMLVGAEVVSGSSFSVRHLSSHSVHVVTPSFELVLESSDRFVNLVQLRPRVALAQLTSHGLLGQTHNAKVHRSTLRYIEGEVDDYTVEEDDLLNTDFAYTRFRQEA